MPIRRHKKFGRILKKYAAGNIVIYLNTTNIAKQTLYIIESVE